MMMTKHTRTYDLYEVVKIPFPFVDTKASKVRPALILSSAKFFNAKVGSSILAMITSMKPQRDLWPIDISINDLDSAGLPAPSIIRLKLFTLDHRLIIERLGILSDPDQECLRQKLKEVLSF